MSEWLVRRGIGGGGVVLSMRRTFLARLVLEDSSPSPVGASALRLMDDESAIVVVVVFVVVVVVLLELPASQRAKSLAELNLSFCSWRSDIHSLYYL